MKLSWSMSDDTCVSPVSFFVAGKKPLSEMEEGDGDVKQGLGKAPERLCENNCLWFGGNHQA